MNVNATILSSKRLSVGLLSMLFFADPSFAEGIQVISPRQYADIEGNSATAGDDVLGRRAQQVYPVSDFESLPPDYHTITKMTLRPTATVEEPLTTTFENLQLRMSTTSVSPPDLSLTFADNVTEDQVLVIDGDVTISTTNTGPAQGPKEFEYELILETPFEYDPSAGRNLLVDWTWTKLTQNFFFDGVGPSGPDSQMVFGAAGGPSDMVAVAQWGGVVTQFTFDSQTSAGDFNEDGFLSAVDIDLLVPGSPDLKFDVDGNGVVDDADRQCWVENLFGTFFGDTDLNKEVNFADFLTLSGNFGKAGGWAEGDFDVSGDVQFADFLQLSGNFGNTKTTLATVPEPSLPVLLLAAISPCAVRRRNACKLSSALRVGRAL